MDPAIQNHRHRLISTNGAGCGGALFLVHTVATAQLFARVYSQLCVYWNEHGTSHATKMWRLDMTRATSEQVTLLSVASRYDKGDYETSLHGSHSSEISAGEFCAALIQATSADNFWAALIHKTCAAVI